MAPSRTGDSKPRRAAKVIAGVVAALWGLTDIVSRLAGLTVDLVPALKSWRSAVTKTLASLPGFLELPSWWWAAGLLAVGVLLLIPSRAWNSLTRRMKRKTRTVDESVDHYREWNHLSVEWGSPPQPDELNILLVNRGNRPVEHCVVEVVGLELWRSGEYITASDMGELGLRVVHDETIDPTPFPSRQHLLVRHRNDHFFIRAVKPPYKKLAIRTEGLWRATLMLLDTESVVMIEFEFYFSWRKNRTPPLRRETSPDSD